MADRLRCPGRIFSTPTAEQSPSETRGKEPRIQSCDAALWITPAGRKTGVMTILKSVVLFALAAAAEIGGAWLIWQSVREDRAWWWAGLGVGWKLDERNTS